MQSYPLNHVKIIADSISTNGDRITTVQLRLPRFVLPQLTRHRTFAFNVRSSRAVPTRKLINEVLSNPVIPSKWGRRTRGMQAKSALSDRRQKLAEIVWRLGALAAVAVSALLHAVGVQKEIANRPMEPWMWVDLVMTATHKSGTANPWENLFRYRCHPHAQEELRLICEQVKRYVQLSVPEIRNSHVPYVFPFEGVSEYEKLQISAARCARVSYAPHDSDGLRDVGKDIELAFRLEGSDPPHLGPFEHCAVADPGKQNGVLLGWQSRRAMIEQESEVEFT